MPAHTPPHKADREDPGPAHRLRMCRLLVADADAVSVCALEIERGGPSYTADTLEHIHGSHPDAELTFIVGADIAGTLASWHEPGRVLELAGLAVAGREGADRERVLEALAEVRAQTAGSGRGTAHVRGVRFLEMPIVSISSSLVRERAARGEAIEDLVGEPVARYIADERLYRQPALERSA